MWWIAWRENAGETQVRGTRSTTVPRSTALRSLAAFLAPVLPLVLAACDGEPAKPADPVPSSVLVLPKEITFTYLGQEEYLGAKVLDQYGEEMDTTASWSATGEGVIELEVDDLGPIVTAVGNGAARLEAKVGRVAGAASLVVAQSPVLLESAGGGGQTGTRGETLAEMVAVYAEDSGGSPAEGVEVTFLAAEGSGEFGDSIVRTSAEGVAETTWTLGAARQQSGVAAAGEFEVAFTAEATSDPPEPDYALIGELEPARSDPLDSEVFEIRALIANLGDGPGPPSFSVEVTSEGAETHSADVGRIEPGDTAAVIVPGGPLQAGVRWVEVAIDPSDAIVEWDEGNNSDSVELRVVSQREIRLGESVTVESEEQGNVFLFRVEIEEGSDEALNVELSGGSGDADLFAHYGRRPDYRYRYRCFSIEGDTGEACQLVPTRAGTYHIAVHAFTAFGPSELEVTLGGREVEPFDIELVFLKGGSTSEREEVEDAAGRWEEIIVRDVFDWDHEEFDPVPAGTCGPGSPAVSDLVDDIRIFVTFDSIDGSGGAMAKSGPCWVRPYPLEGGEGIWLQPTLAAIVIDEDDLADLDEDLVDAFMQHEMAHALGFVPSLWDRHDLLRDPSLPDDPDADPHFDGPEALAAFDAAGGSGYEDGKVPLEDGAKEGVSDSHWRDDVMGSELMTPSLTGDEQPLSAITVGAFHDLGYEVDPAEADGYVLAHERRFGEPRIVRLGHDIAPFPVRVYRTVYKRLGAERPEDAAPRAEPAGRPRS